MKPDEYDVPAQQPQRHRAIWISDIHLGTPGCKAEYLLDFLKWNESDQLYLVGDIIDGWQLKKFGMPSHPPLTNNCRWKLRPPGKGKKERILQVG